MHPVQRSPSRLAQALAMQARPSEMRTCSARRGSMAGSMSLLKTIREEFRACGGSEDVPITAGELARHWYSMAQEERKQTGAEPLRSEDRNSIALRAAHAVNGMGLRQTGTVHMDEWVHDRLLAASELPTPALAAQINSAAQLQLQRQPQLLAEVQWLLEVADSPLGAMLTVEDISKAYSQSHWRLSAGLEGLQVLSDSELQFSDPVQLARGIVQAADLTGRHGLLSYAELLAFCLGLRKQVVSLALYDLSDGLARRITPYILGTQMDGLWHTSIIAFGIEYFFGGDICRSIPGQTKFGKATKVLPLGITLCTATDLESFLARGLKADFNRDSYDVLHHNCNHFSDRVSLHLVGRRIPEEVLRMPECAATAPAVLRPLLNHWLSGAEARARTGPKTAGDQARPPPLSRQPHSASDFRPLANGQVVGVLPSQGQSGQATIGLVWKPNYGGRGPVFPPAPENKVWVRFFEPPSMQHRGKIRTELVELARIQTSALAFTGDAYDAAIIAINSPPRAKSNRSSPSLSDLHGLGFEARQVEAALALVAGSQERAMAVLRFQGRSRKVLGDVTLKAENLTEHSDEAVVYSALGVPAIEGKAKYTPLEQPNSTRWAVPPSDLLSGSRRHWDPSQLSSPPSHSSSMVAPPSEPRQPDDVPNAPPPSHLPFAFTGSMSPSPGSMSLPAWAGTMHPVPREGTPLRRTEGPGSPSPLPQRPFAASARSPARAAWSPPTRTATPTPALPARDDTANFELRRARRLTVAGLGGLGGA
eukprot:TRINITY_DN39946_c0_g1_i1.p1 TRINITY_DN39946_c0_g1~~TRINITY_DN39946_c0_g1_i1.p1  ORF type:complete len:764 (-),score=126.78 TRINITY_DN39946_c0_g1_i1:78-2369(-)